MPTGRECENLHKTLWTAWIPIAIRPVMFRRSSAVEQLTVNQLVVGSIPTAGAKIPLGLLVLLDVKACR